MNYWRLLFALVAVVHPIASFTERNLVDGSYPCCDRETSSPLQDSRYSPHGSYRYTRDSSLLRYLSSQDDIEDRRQDLRHRESWYRTLTERTVLDNRDRSILVLSNRIEHHLNRVSKAQDRRQSTVDRERSFRNINDAKAEDRQFRIGNQFKNDINTARNHNDRVRNHVNDDLSKNVVNNRRQTERVQEIRNGKTQLSDDLARALSSRSSNDRQRILRMDMGLRDSFARFGARNQENRRHNFERLAAETRSLDENTRLLEQKHNMRIRLYSRQENQERKNTVRAESRPNRANEVFKVDFESRIQTRRDSRDNDNRNIMARIDSHLQRTDNRWEVRESSDNNIRRTISRDIMRTDIRNIREFPESNAKLLDNYRRDTQVNKEKTREHRTNSFDRRTRITREEPEFSHTSRIARVNIQQNFAEERRNLIHDERESNDRRINNERAGVRRERTHSESRRERTLSMDREVMERLSGNHLVRLVEREVRESSATRLIRDDLRREARNNERFSRDSRATERLTRENRDLQSRSERRIMLNTLNSLQRQETERQVRSDQRRDISGSREFNLNRLNIRDTTRMVLVARERLSSDPTNQSQKERVSTNIVSPLERRILDQRIRSTERRDVHYTKESNDREIRNYLLYRDTRDAVRLARESRNANLAVERRILIAEESNIPNTKQTIERDTHNIRIATRIDNRYSERLGKDTRDSMESNRDIRNFGQERYSRINEDERSLRERRITSRINSARATLQRSVETDKIDDIRNSKERETRYTRDSARRDTANTRDNRQATERHLQSLEQRSIVDFRDTSERQSRNIRYVRDTRTGENDVVDDRRMTARILEDQTNKRRTLSAERRNIQDNRDVNGMKIETHREMIRRDTRHNDKLSRTREDFSLRESRMASRGQSLESKDAERRNYSEKRNVRYVRDLSRDSIRAVLRNTRERQIDNRYRSIEMTGHLQNGLNNNVEEIESTIGSWQFTLYTLQAAYLCGLLMQMLTPKNNNLGKNMKLYWWPKSITKLIKVD